MLVILIQSAFRNRIFGSKSNKPALNYVYRAQWWVTAKTQAWLFFDIGENDKINPQPVTGSGNTSAQSILIPEKHPQQICPQIHEYPSVEASILSLHAYNLF